MDSSGITSHYVMNGNQPLSATTGGNTTFYLYGLGPIGELTSAWSYSLPDGTGTSRQVTDASGTVTFAATYTPWGDTFESFGEGSFTWGYFGGLMDAATGLLYVGNGQYYDPSTGRFLTRGANPNSTNPYVPWNGDPSGAFLAPLALLSLVFSKKRKRGKWDMFIIVLVLGLSLGLGVSACGGGTPTPAPAPGTNPAPETTPGVGGTEGAGTVTGDSGLVTVSPVTIVAYSCPTPDVANASTSTPPPTPTPTPYPSNAQMFLDAVLKHETELKQTPGFSVAILLAMGAVETGGGGQGYSAYSNTVYGGVLQVKGEFSGASGTYDNTPQGYENNVMDAISTIKSFSKIDRENYVFSDLYNYYETVKIDVARNVLYYNAGYGWWQDEAGEGYVTHPADVGYTGSVASMLSIVVPRDFGYRDDAFVNPMLSVQNAVNCELKHYPVFNNLTCNK